MADDKKAKKGEKGDAKKPAPQAKAGDAKKGGEGRSKKGASPAGETAAVAQSANPNGPARLRTLYQKEITAKLQQQFGYKNPMEIPKLVKITLNMGLGEAIENPKIIEAAAEELGAISGQKPVVTRAKKSIANFKLREGMPIGVMVTLRRDRMYEFLERLVSLALPRVRDFKGVSTKAFDGKGNYSLGLREQIIFPEINYDKIDKIKGMNITIVTTAKNDEEGRALLTHFGMPFRK